MKSVLLSLIAVLIAAFPLISTADESEPRIITEAGKKTLEILQTEILDMVTLNPDNPQKGFELLKAKLEKRGVTVRLKSYGDPKSKHTPGGPLALRNIPLDKFMKYFDEWAWWGWIIYPDGSITYFDSQCACTWPKNGIYCHDAQYEAGKPENMAKDQK